MGDYSLQMQGLVSSMSRLRAQTSSFCRDDSPHNQWMNVSEDVAVTSSTLVQNRDGAWADEVDGEVFRLTDTALPENARFEKFRSLDFQLRFENVFTQDISSIKSPLPLFSWADSQEVWRNMLQKERTFQRDSGLFRHHPELLPRMRTILLDWLSEVCEVYRLHKETFNLCVDFIDRYLSVMENVPKTQLQLTGITALFIAAKLEEIYPPKLAEFAYVTDSACSEADIIRMEMIILKALKWNLSPMTSNAWLSVFLQTANIEHIKDSELGFVFPQFSKHAYMQISRLLDLCLMDVGSLQFRYSQLAATALYHHTSTQLVTEVTGLNWADLYPCIKWMAPFAKAMLEAGQTPIKFFTSVPPEDCHTIQTHNVDMALVDRALCHQSHFLEMDAPIDLTAQLSCLLTTPSSKRSPRDSLESDSCCKFRKVMLSECDRKLPKVTIHI